MTTQASLLPKQQASPDDDSRVRRFMQLMSAYLNNLIAQGTIFISPGLPGSGGGLGGMANLFFTSIGPPAATLGYKGDYCLDLTTGILYQNE